MSLHVRSFAVGVASIAFCALLIAAPGALHAQAPLALGPAPSMEAAIVDSATQTLREIMTQPGKGIPTKLLADAQGLVIVPGMVKGGFIVGAKHGRGVVLVRDPTGAWRLPQFVAINGASVGWQVGLQSTDLVLVFRTPKSVQGLLSGKFTIGADASAAAGPVGRDVAAATDVAMRAEILSYSHSRGLFAGVSLDGSGLRMLNDETNAYYQPAPGTPQPAPGQPIATPPSAARLLEEIARYSRPDAAAAAVPVAGAPLVPAGAPIAAAADPRVVQQNLAAASQRLGALVDAQWQAYLAFPPETYGIERAPNVEALTQTLARFQAVAANPQYAPLAQRPEFVETFRLAQELLAALPKPALALPPPPR